MLSVVFVVISQLCWTQAEPVSGSRYAFWRSSEGAGGTVGARSAGRRVFGGSVAELNEWGAACALLDRYWTPRCSGSVVSSHWVLTAAHCISSRIAYVKYNTRRPLEMDGNVTAILYLYRHPRYKVVQEDEGRGMDVTQLHHDVGLVRTRNNMILNNPPAHNPLRSSFLYNPVELQNEEIKVLGFGRTEGSQLGEELFSVQLRLVPCERRSWEHCMCGVALRNERRGVCSGDSGGPVIYRGTQIAVTSMGPVECSTATSNTLEDATSVFTLLQHYTTLVNATLADADAETRMLKISRGHTTALRRLPISCCCTILYVMFTYSIKGF